MTPVESLVYKSCSNFPLRVSSPKDSMEFDTFHTCWGGWDAARCWKSHSLSEIFTTGKEITINIVHWICFSMISHVRLDAIADKQTKECLSDRMLSLQHIQIRQVRSENCWSETPHPIGTSTHSACRRKTSIVEICNRFFHVECVVQPTSSFGKYSSHRLCKGRSGNDSFSRRG